MSNSAEGDVVLPKLVRMTCMALSYAQLAVAAFLPRYGLPTKPWEVALAVAFVSSVVLVPVVLIVASVVSAARHVERRRGLVARAVAQALVSAAILVVLPWFFSFVEDFHSSLGFYGTATSISETPQSILLLGLMGNLATYLLFARGVGRT